MTTDMEKTAVDLVTEFHDAVGGVRGWQSALAHAMGVSPSYVCKLASGASKGTRVPHYTMTRLLDAVRDPRSALQGAASSASRRRFTASSPANDLAPQEPEFAAMQTLAALDDSVRLRVLAWADSRWGSK